MFDWLFRDRRTNKIVLFQVPNAPLIGFLAVAIVQRLFRPSGDVDTALKAGSAGLLIWWASDEAVRGVNPFRRMLGAVVIAFTVAGLLRQAA